MNPRLTYRDKMIAVVGEVKEGLARGFADPDNPPWAGLVDLSRIQHRGGSAVALDGFTDDGCSGLVWVNVLRSYRTDDFPVETQTPTCRATRALLVQVGVARCVSTMDDGGFFPSGSVLEDEATYLLDDAARLDSALCVAARCLEGRELVHAYTIHSGEPIGPDGGLVSWIQTISFQL